MKLKIFLFVLLLSVIAYSQEFQIPAEITSISNPEALEVLNYIKDNYAGKIHYLTLNGESKTITFMLVEANYTIAIAIITDFVTTYGNRFINWSIHYEDL